MTPLSEFIDRYFAFLLSGNVTDFTDAHGAMAVALDDGASWESLQQCMDQSHATADMVRVIHNVMAEEMNSNG